MRTLHRLTSIQPEQRTADCSACGPAILVRYRTDRAKWVCAITGRGTAPYGNRYSRKHQLRSRFGMSLEDYDALLLSQGGVCAICASVDPAGRALAVDHCHESDRIRGLLCGPCNRALGLFRDDAELLARASAYLSG